MLKDVFTVVMKLLTIGDHGSSGTRALTNFFQLFMPALHGVGTLMWMKA